jgi:diguanylate cyclase (GGDEF)-like protein/PAS domain S-box-containing protein
MIFRFTPVVLFLFFGALFGVSVLLLQTSYKSAKTALQFEQIEQLMAAHEIAQQYLNFRLSEAKRALINLKVQNDDDYQPGRLENALQHTILDYALRFRMNGDEVVVDGDTYGQLVDGVETLLFKNAQWTIEKTGNGPALVIQVPIQRTEQDSVKIDYIIKGGIYLRNNLTLTHNLRSASRAFAHYLILDDMSLVTSSSLEDGVEDVAQQVMTSREPVFAEFGDYFSGDIQPLRLESGHTNLKLLSVVNAQGSQNWQESFKRTILLSLLFALLVCICGTYFLHFWTHHSLSKLLEYARRVRSQGEAVRYQPGTIQEFNSVGQVIEEMVDELSEQSKYITDMLEAGNSPIVSWDLDGSIRVLNKAMQKIFRLKSSDSFKNIDEFFEKFPDVDAQQACLQALQGHTTQGLETKTKIDGHITYIMWNVTPLRDTNENVSGVICMGQDVTERRVAEGNLRLSSTVFDNTAEGIMITDDKSDIIDVNTAFSEITGYSREEVIGQNPRIMKSGKHTRKFYDAMWRDLNQKGFWRGEIWDRRKNGEEFPKWLSINACRNERGHLTHYVAVFSDITDKKADEVKLEQLAHFDHLTGLPNRILFHDRLHTALARSRREKEHMAVLFVDLDRFKQINDSLGHRVGDLLLKEVSSRLLHSVREIDTVARLSGDEFTVILTDIASIEAIEFIASRIVKSLGAPYFFEGHELFVSASVGISIYPSDGENGTDLLRHADVAMYHAKEKGRNNYQFFNAAMNEKAQTQLSLANKLRVALNRKLIHPHYQLKVDITTLRPVGLEALARWNDERGHPVSPAHFVHVAEEHGLIARLGKSKLNQVCIQIRMWQDMNVEFGSVAVNLSAQQFRDANLLNDIQEAISDNRIDPQTLEVEVTENMVMDDVEDAIMILNRIKEMGLKISIDDFGTGYSSLSYLKRFPVDTLKIDRTFIRDLSTDNDDAAIVSAIVSLAQKLDINVVAEGVETQEQVDFLRSVGCNIVQGFLYAKPCPGGEVPLVWHRLIEDFIE